MAEAKRVLVTGASGFVGRATAPGLTAAGWEVVPGRRDRLAEDAARCAAVVHLAGRAHVMRETSGAPGALYRADNTELTMALARAAVAAGIRRFVFMSSAKVWGEGRNTPYSEADPPAPEDDYARSKLAAEEGLFALARKTGLEVVVLRPPLVYGPDVRANFLSLIKAVDRGLPLPLGAIRNRRSLVSVANLASAVVAAVSHPAAGTKVFAVSDGEDVSTPDLIRRIAAALGKPARLWRIPGALLATGATLLGRKAAYDRLAGSLTVDSTEIRKALAWTPSETLDQGLAATARWFRSGKENT